MRKSAGAKRKAVKTEMEAAIHMPDTTRPMPKRMKENSSYWEEPRNMEDLWKAAFPVGTSWDQLDSVYNEFPWDFSNLEEAFEDKGKLNRNIVGTNNKVYLFGTTELHNVAVVPVVLAIVSPSPPSSELSFKEQCSRSPVGGEEVKIPMKKLKMDWIPYVPLDKRGIEVERVMKTSPIFVLGCTQRRAAVRHLKRDRVMQLQQAVPCLDHDRKAVNLDVIKEFMLDELILNDEFLPADTKEFLMRLVRNKLCEARKLAASFENMRIYKFYPVQTPYAIPKSPCIHFYSRNAHEFL